MELSNEDSLRLHVLIKNVQAVRIDENALVVYGLAGNGGTSREAKVPLNPTCRPEQYLRRVREFFSGAVLGSPGGYPLHLNRWTRMGQTKDGILAELLMLGELEAVTAVSGAIGLTHELAQRVWWIAPTSENARRMLARNCVVEGALGKVLAHHLVEHLPFETEARFVIESVRLVLQPGLIDDATRRRLWDKGAKQHAYRIGFLQATPHELPQPLPARADSAQHAQALATLAAQGNALAELLQQVLDSRGQSFLATAATVLQHTGQQDGAVAILNTLGGYFARAYVGGHAGRDVQEIVRTAATFCAAPQPPALARILDALPALRADIAAAVAISLVNETIALDILAHTSATGTLLRKKLEPITHVILQQLATLTRTGRDD